MLWHANFVLKAWFEYPRWLSCLLFTDCQTGFKAAFSRANPHCMGHATCLEGFMLCFKGPPRPCPPGIRHRRGQFVLSHIGCSWEVRRGAWRHAVEEHSLLWNHAVCTSEIPPLWTSGLCSMGIIMLWSGTYLNWYPYRDTSWYMSKLILFALIGISRQVAGEAVLFAPFCGMAAFIGTSPRLGILEEEKALIPVAKVLVYLPRTFRRLWIRARSFAASVLDECPLFNLRPGFQFVGCALTCKISAEIYKK